MKNTLIFLIALASNNLKAQEFPSPFEFTLIDSVISNKAELFVRAKTWLLKTFPEKRAEISMEDKEQGRLMGKGFVLVPKQSAVMNPGSDTIEFAITIDLKDGKYRAVFSDYVYLWNGYRLNDPQPKAIIMLKKYWIKIRQISADKSGELLSDLKSKMAAPKEDF